MAYSMNTLKIYTATIKDTFLLSPIPFYHQFSRDLQLAYHLFVISPETLEREARCSAKNIEQYHATWWIPDSCWHTQDFSPSKIGSA